MHPISLAVIRDHDPYASSWRLLLAGLGYQDGQYDPHRRVTLGDVAAISNLGDALWCARCLPDEARPDLVRAVMPALQRAAMRVGVPAVDRCATAIQGWIADAECADLAAATAALRAAALDGAQGDARAAYETAARAADWAAARRAAARNYAIVAARRATAVALAADSLRAAAAAYDALHCAAAAAMSLAEAGAFALGIDHRDMAEIAEAAEAAERDQQTADLIAVFGRCAQ